MKKNQAGLNILITGSPGSGKTTLIKKVLEELDKQLDFKGGGFYTQEIRDENLRKGFSLVTLEREEGILAHIGIQSPNKVGKYSVDVEELEKMGVSAIEKAIREKDIVVIDEIGKMELFSDKFKKAVLEALDGNILVLATIGKVSHPFVRDVKGRKDICLLEMTRGNRDYVRAKIMSLIREALKE